MNVSAATFDEQVIRACATVPVVVDFWAPWCAPCRALGPILERLEREYGGRFRLAKVNLDENPDLAAAFGVRSIPEVMAFRDGRPVAHFLGAQPEAAVRAFLDSLLPSPSEAARMAGGEASLRRALELDARNDAARLDLAELLVQENRIDDAEALLDEVQDNSELNARREARREALRAAARFARGGGESAEALQARLAANPGDLEARYALAERHAAARRYREAMDELLAIVRSDKNWRGGEARRQLLNLFTLAAHEPALVTEYRRKLATALY